VHNNLGICYYKQEKIDLAITEYLRSIELDPFMVEAHYNLGVCYDMQEKTDLAIGEYRRAIELNPYDANAYYKPRKMFL
jgi:tetratricopeptide (TPR) repeat protein